MDLVSVSNKICTICYIFVGALLFPIDAFQNGKVFLTGSETSCLADNT